MAVDSEAEKDPNKTGAPGSSAGVDVCMPVVAPGNISATFIPTFPPLPPTDDPGNAIWSDEAILHELNMIIIGKQGITDQRQAYKLVDMYFKKLNQSAGARSRCGAVWNGQHVAYRCTTCGVSPSSCMCVDCFNAGDHEGHDFFVYRSDYGGCCDCGDPSTWQPSGFCKKHRGFRDGDPSCRLPERIRTILPKIIDAQLRRFCALVDRAAMEQQKRLEETGGGWKNGQKAQEPVNTPVLNGIRAALQHHIKWVLKLCDVHDGMRRVIGNAFDNLVLPDLLTTTVVSNNSNDTIDIPRQSQSVIEWLLRKGALLDSDTDTQVTNVFLDLMFDQQFKKRFSIIFLENYEPLIFSRLQLQDGPVDPREVANANLSSSLDRVTVQLFSIKQITLDLLHTEKLLTMLLGTTRNLLGRALILEYLPPTVNNYHAILSRRSFFQCTHDLRFVLDHAEVVECIFNNDTFRKQLWGGWIQLWSLLMLANRHTRVTTEHVPHDDHRWGNCLVLESDLHAASMAMFDTTENRLPWQTTLQLATDTWLALEKWYVSQRENQPWWSNGDIDTENKMHCSFHIPLARVLAQLVHTVCVRSSEDIKKIFETCGIKSQQEMFDFVDLPIRCLAFHCQVMQGRWRRNGDSVWSEGMFYRKHYWHHMLFDPDVLALRIGALVMKPEDFIDLHLRRFVLGPSLSAGLTPCLPISAVEHAEDEYVVGTVNYFVLLLLFSTAPLSPLSFSDFIEQLAWNCIHCLAVADRTHSELSDNLVRNHNKLDEVLEKIADFKQPDETPSSNARTRTPGNEKLNI